MSLLGRHLLQILVLKRRLHRFHLVVVSVLLLSRLVTLILHRLNLCLIQLEIEFLLVSSFS